MIRVGLKGSASSCLLEELRMDHGRDFQVEVSPTIPYRLRGVQYAAHKFVKYKTGETPVVHGWVYGFGESFQIFIIYMALEKEAYDDPKGIMKILKSLE
jgi:hypothetical protein